MAISNDGNGHIKTQKKEQISVTKDLASFVANASPEQLTPELHTKVKEVLVDYIGVVVGALDNADSSDSIYSAVRGLQGLGNTGKCTVLGKGEPAFLPQYAGMLNATFGHSLDFDDTYAPGTLHAGVTAISAALAQSESIGSAATSEKLMLAISVAYEVTCRLGRELGYEAYSQGMHNTSTAGIFGSVAAISVLKDLSAETIEMAFGLAGSKAAGSMQYLDNGSWNKRLHPGFAVHDAFICVSLAEAGVIGATRIIEGKMGFLHAYSPNEDKDMQRLTKGLGQEWIWLSSSLKPYPACRMTHGFIEIAGDIHDRRPRQSLEPSDVQEVVLFMSPSNYLLVGDPTPNKIHPTNVIDAQFSAYYQVANALLHGSNSGLQAYRKLSNADIHALSDKIVVQVDPAMERFSAKLQIRFVNGNNETKTILHPLGEKQHPYTLDRVNEKFLSLAQPVYGGDRSSEILQVVERLEDHQVEDLLKLLR